MSDEMEYVPNPHDFNIYPQLLVRCCSESNGNLVARVSLQLAKKPQGDEGIKYQSMYSHHEGHPVSLGRTYSKTILFGGLCNYGHCYSSEPFSS